VYLDFPQDRTSIDGGTQAQKMQLYKWLNEVGLPAIKKKLASGNMTGASSDWVEFEQGAYVIAATPNASHGYLYVGAWTKA